MNDLHVRLKYKKGDADDWTKVEDKALRKKLQNRLAKRKSRITSTKAASISRSKKPREPETGDKPEELAEKTISLDEGDNILRSNTLNDIQTVSTVRDLIRASRTLHGTFVNEVEAYLANPSLHEHRFICLSQYSFLRATLQNARIMALDLKLLADDEALSPWTLTSPYPMTSPHDLNPTPLQLCTPHHPYIDIVPSAAFRDNIIFQLADNPLEDKFCYELHGGAVTIWGSQPWATRAWEVSQTFVTNWSWLIDEETIRSSNYWRGERGEGPLIMPDLSGAVLDNMAGGVLGEVF